MTYSSALRRDAELAALKAENARLRGQVADYERELEQHSTTRVKQREEVGRLRAVLRCAAGAKRGHDARKIAREALERI